VFESVLDLQLESDRGAIQFALTRSDESVPVSPIDDSTVRELIDRTNELQRDGSFGLAFFTANTAEFIVEDSNSVRPMRMRDDLIVENAAEGLRYSLGRPSAACALSLADEVADLPMRDRPVSMRLPFSRYSRVSNDGVTDPLWLLVEFSRISSLQIISDKKRSPAEWIALAESFYFHVGFNLDYALIPRQFTAALSRSSRIQRLRRTAPAELEAPKRVYIPELVRSYQLALSSESPMLAYLSFYHVAEHWFEEVFLEDIASKIQSTITSPGFSAKRQKDLRGLIRTVSKSLRARDDEIVISESNALELTLAKYLDLSDLTRALKEFDQSSTEYFSRQSVEFAEGKTVDLSADRPAAIKALAQRIYATRNSLVHRKDGDKKRFTPFKDDPALLRELPLMRFIAEQIIIGSSSVL
jgi:hypothetical protein